MVFSKDTGSRLGSIAGTALILSELIRRNCRIVREGMLVFTVLRDICGSNSSRKPFEDNNHWALGVGRQLSTYWYASFLASFLSTFFDCWQYQSVCCSTCFCCVFSQPPSTFAQMLPSLKLACWAMQAREVFSCLKQFCVLLRYPFPAWLILCLFLCDEEEFSYLYFRIWTFRVYSNLDSNSKWYSFFPLYKDGNIQHCLWWKYTVPRIGRDAVVFINVWYVFILPYFYNVMYLVEEFAVPEYPLYWVCSSMCM